MHKLIITGLAVMMTAGCTPAGAPLTVSDRTELVTMKPGNVVPKSSPATFIRAFRQFCAAHPDNADGIPAALRAADYVEVPTNGPGRSFIVDDRRPAVILIPADHGAHCGVSATSRTGQTARVTAMVAQDYPQARALDPALFGTNAEAAWALGDGTYIYTMRSGAHPVPTTTYTLAIGRL